MLSSIRKFSTSIYAKILLGIVVIPFVFWGMGTSFRGGNKNVVVVIDEEKFSTKEFANFVYSYQNSNEEINSEKIDQLLSVFIGNKLIEKEYNNFGIKLSDISLSKLIKIQKEFKSENKFSRTQYEKFLITNNLDAVSFEKNLANQEKRKQLLNIIGGGIVPSKFMVNNIYNKINQKRKIELINLNEIFKKKTNFTEDQIKSYFESNKNKYKEIYKSIKLIELNPKQLVGSEEFNDGYFKKIDEIDYMLIEGKNLEDIIQSFNLQKARSLTLNASGEDVNLKAINNISKNLAKAIFNSSDEESTTLIEIKDKYFIVEIIKTEEIQRSIESASVKNDIILNLEIKNKRKMMSKIIARVNKNDFDKSDFDKLSKDETVPIKKITLKNQNDESSLKKDLVSHIYAFSEKKVAVVSDINFLENYLVYIDEIENVNISDTSKEYLKYLDLSKNKITNELYNTYDNYIRKRYKIDINYQALDIVKNRFNQ